MRHITALLISSLAFTACEDVTGPTSSGLSIEIAPLTLPGLSKVCYDLRVTNGTNGAGSTVWQKGNPAVEGAADTDRLCSTEFGNGGGGAITFVGACDASPASPGDTGRTNSVTLWVDSLYATGGAQIAENGSDGWQDPCPSGCTLEALCQENSDTKVEFNLTILRQANQGFFDIGVNFDDIFCSAKVDCKSGSDPIKLLFNPVTGQRDTTIVSAFACTAGAGAGLDTILYRDPLKITCGATVTELAPNFGKGNAWGAGTADPAPADAIWQYAVYADDENLTCGGAPCNKRFWNVAFGLDPNADNCTLTTTMTASASALSNFTTPTPNTYPYIKVDVPLTNTTGLICNTHPLDGSNGVSTQYTPITTPEIFDTNFTGTGFGTRVSDLTDPYFDKVSFLMNADGPDGIKDQSLIPHAITLSGNTVVSTTESRFGGASVAFDGNGDILSTASSSRLAFGTGDFTVETYYRRTARIHPYPRIWQFGPIGASGWMTNQHWALVDGSADFDPSRFVLHVYSYAGNSAAMLISQTQPVSGRWYHLAVTRQGNTWRLFVDGTLEASINWSGAVDNGISNMFSMGGVGLDGNDFLQGHVDEVRITKGLARYTGNFTVPAAPAPVVPPATVSLLIHGDGTNGSTTFTDSSANSLPLTAAGNAQVSTAIVKMGTGSIALDGVGDYVTTGTSSQLAFGTTDFTVETWYRRTDRIHPYPRIWQFGGIGASGWNTSQHWALIDGHSSFDATRFVLHVYNFAGNSSAFFKSQTVIAAGQWYHLAITREGDTWRMFVNGILEATRVWSGMPDNGISNIFTVGAANYNNQDDFCKGHVDDVRIVRGRALYKVDFTPPTAPLATTL